MVEIIRHSLLKLGMDEKGASAVEYAIIVGIVGAAIATGAQAFGTGIIGVFSGLLAKLNLTS